MKSIMVQGTTSYAGKSFLVMVLCRILRRRGYKVAPFKSQNTSLNSFVTKDGFEIARAQALQAFAAGVEPSVDMNPVLVKPRGESRSQVVVNGKPFKDIEAWNYYSELVPKLKGIVKEAYRKLENIYDVIVIEGAGSPAEINIYGRDIANMWLAEAVRAPVILIADIDRGGVFASIFGTLSLLEEKHRRMVEGIIINKFRGDIEILKPGIKQIEKLVRKPVLGVIPYIENLQLPGEDSMSISDSKDNGLDVAVIRLPRISNFTDFDPLQYDGVRVRYVERSKDIGRPSAIIIPGTKSTVDDLEWMKRKGFVEKIRELKEDIPVVGICGGYQMLGKRIIDNGIENRSSREVEGIGLLNTETRFNSYSKKTVRVKGRVVASRGILERMKGAYIEGYEIHMGETSLGKGAEPAFEVEGKYDGAVEGMVFGTYIHGIFDSSGFRRGFIRCMCTDYSFEGSGDLRDAWDRSVDRAADAVSDSVDIDKILRIAGV